MGLKRKRNSKGQYAPEHKGKHAPVANPAYAEGMRMLRQSNAAGIHEDKRTKRARTRSDALRKDIKDQEE